MSFRNCWNRQTPGIVKRGLHIECARSRFRVKVPLRLMNGPDFCACSRYKIYHPELIPDAHERTTQPPAAPLIHTIGATFGILFPFVGMIAAMMLSWQRGWFDRSQLTILVVGYVLTGLGITLGFHRLFTHRSFATYGWMRAFWMMMGSLAVQKSPIEWCATHRKHHALSDKPGDPHSPHENPPGFLNSLKGFWHAHVGWLVTG